MRLPLKRGSAKCNEIAFQKKKFWGLAEKYSTIQALELEGDRHTWGWETGRSGRVPAEPGEAGLATKEDDLFGPHRTAPSESTLPCFPAWGHSKAPDTLGGTERSLLPERSQPKSQESRGQLLRKHFKRITGRIEHPALVRKPWVG